MSLYDLTVLAVDDNKHTLAIITQVLRGLGVGRTYQAENPAEALRLLQSTPVDIVLADLEMGPTDGLLLVRAIRASADQAISMLPVIVVTAHSTELMVARARDAGATEFVTKPFSVKSLASRLEESIFRPRPFVRTDDYFGPDRRRRVDDAYFGPERRSRLIIDSGAA